MIAAMKAAQGRIDSLFHELVPREGKADTVAGEIVRAVCRLGYRFYNDGDKIGVEYGKETCNQAARYLMNRAGENVAEIISGLWGMYFDDEYEAGLASLVEAVLAYLNENPELKKKENTEDMFDFYDAEEDVDDEEEDEDW